MTYLPLLLPELRMTHHLVVGLKYPLSHGVGESLQIFLNELIGAALSSFVGLKDIP